MASILKGYPVVNISNTVMTTLYTAPALTISSLISVILSNKLTNSGTVSIQIVRVGGLNTANLVTNAPIPAGGALDAVVNKPIVLNPGDYIQAQASAASQTDVTVSVLEQA